jgi:cytochrome c-type biogenesis protein CcmF
VRQAEFTLTPGQEVRFAGHTLSFVGTEVVDESNKTVTKALVEVDGTGPWAPALNQFAFGNQTIGTPSVRSTPRDDVALTLLALPQGDGAVTIRVTVQPLVVWLWLGGGVMVVGTILSAFPGRRRDPLDPASAPLPERPARAAEPVAVPG